ncbi:hypothetical protein FSP39_017981 [Pinctada imbricata]|uniref:Carboxylesterase type B domain-containing protein n=1 Tax=Pinctada imbricata TaxID=66713 RepID=A0AA89BV76_PINIB|nr:hypothetical protein FSP39_017981 [Pinctada imbricata]
MNDTSAFPVMVFVHGESYDMGTGNAYDGSVLASFGKVIVVTVNYRLGVFGFLSTADRKANGNQALLDLLAVLTWIKDNIISFDGDPNRVTLFGHRHGAALINLLMLSDVVSADPSMKFHRAILQSGSAYSTWAISYDPVTCTHKLAENVNCSYYLNETKNLINCLRRQTANELVKNRPYPPKYFSCFAPTFENAAFFSEDSIEELMSRQSGIFSKIHVMFGVTKNAAHSFLSERELQNGISEFRKHQIIRTYVQNVYKYHRQKIFEILDHQYSEWDRLQDDRTRRDNILQFLNDAQFVVPLLKMAYKHSRLSDTYLYAFDHSKQISTKEFQLRPDEIYGDELPYIFGKPFVAEESPSQTNFRKDERELSAFMMRMWTNFAKSGNPNYPGKTSIIEGRRYSSVNWSEYEEHRQFYLQIGRRAISRYHFRGKQFALWNELIPKINLEPSKHIAKSAFTQHNLVDSANLSTFDDPQQLIQIFHRSSHVLEDVDTSTPLNDKDWSIFKLDLNNESLPSHWRTTDALDDHTSSTALSVSGLSTTETVIYNSLPISITVSIGCTFLIFNILIFAGVYYQRQKIKMFRKDQSRSYTDYSFNSNKEETEQNYSDLHSSEIIQQNKQSNCNSEKSSHKSMLSTRHDSASYRYSYVVTNLSPSETHVKNREDVDSFKIGNISQPVNNTYRGHKGVSKNMAAEKREFFPDISNSASTTNRMAVM